MPVSACWRVTPASPSLSASPPSALVGGWSLASDPQGSTSTAVLAAAVAALAGIGTFSMLAWLGRRGGAVAGDAPRIDRRRFLTGVAASVLTAGLAAILARRVRAGDSVDAQREDTVLPDPGDSSAPPVSEPFELPGLSPYVTPNADFYRIDTALSTPQVDAGDWRLRITGLVDAPFELGYDELLALDSVETTVTIACVSNEVGGRLVGNAVWQGVPLATLLDRAGVRSDASQVVGRSVDGFTAGFPLDTARDGRTAIVAYAMNGEPLPADHGYPARLIVAGLYGYVSATKWLEEIELTTWESFDGYWVPARLVEGGTDQDGVTHRRTPLRRRRRGRPPGHCRRRLGTHPGHHAASRCKSTTNRGSRPSSARSPAPTRGSNGTSPGTPPPASTASACGRPTATASPRPKNLARRHPTAPPAGTPDASASPEPDQGDKP